MARSAFHQPFGDYFAETAERAGDQITTIGLHRKTRGPRFAAPRHERLRKCDHHFADVFATRHQAERRIDPARRK